MASAAASPSSGGTTRSSFPGSARPGPASAAWGIRLWREFVFPALGVPFAISYQDADMHSGRTYRFDGWERSPMISRSGSDARSGRQGRRKWVWVWPAIPAEN
jgi:antitoxin VapB